MSFNLASQQVTLHEPVFLNFEVNNSSGSTLHLDLGANRVSNFEIKVTEPSGKVVGPIRETVEGFSRLGRISVAPSENFKSSLLLNKFYEFREPGNYEIEVRLDSAITDDSGRTVMASASNKVTLTVLPRDAAKLESVAQELSERADHASSYSERESAVSALSYIVDPVAVPYLKRVMEQGQQVRIEAAQGLARVRTPDAVDALIAAEAASPDNEFREQVRNVLRDLSKKTTDPEMKAKISAALQRS